MTTKIPIGSGEVVFMKPGDDVVGCEVHDWPNEDFVKRVFDAMRERHGKGGLNVCRECLLRARALAKAAAELG
jgi:hypothetical protein